MAIDAVTLPSAVTTVDTRDGNSYDIYLVQHDGVNDTVIPVSDACVSAAVLTDDMTDAVITQTTGESTGISLLNKTTGTSGLSFGAWRTSDGMKQIEIDSAVAAGTYRVVARFTGSAGGFGGGANTLDL